MTSTATISNTDIQALEKHAQQAADLLKQLGNVHRLMILCTLVNGERSVGELHSLTHLSQSALSQHLASLRNAGLVQTRREAQSIFYSLLGSESIQIISVLKTIYCPTL
ncbi:MAG: metalloregulator ArsR/SmtB family transcription factor [Porticoccaceae bacterium]|jgi:DNA-binding transcriptional ArsR family regulator|nr:metalloregulator ArsR/SmtB family transcription factor [Porticoccaceae bacterium]MDP4655223.1 metalloregulator ArsR/SmtB family transcription factor [Alphaproteobacteria bacterium]MDP4745965.1 metalloregulator ArsR/SmtB family transcription factor [Porticoccaceae bacterium]MDP4753632.1 metalloregulator ArsR/SmtB family transcription factor [Porticoccaceae bacterium]MDP4890685.1 metalloregulator ArsR/SmtB family transcription factor [Porticoccaceae bacterium]|tara:strand:- start:3350 stop:3676 length:327 start_codon:yes stop_codon:yes gene_type:complete